MRRREYVAASVGALSLFVVLALASCAGPSAVDAADAGRTKRYEPGVPNFDMEAVVRLQEAGPVIDVFTSIPHVSLAFVRSGNRYVSEYEIVTRISDRETRDLVEENSQTITFSVSDFDSTRGFEPHSRATRLQAPAGSYVAEVMLTDLNTGEMARRRQSIRVPTSGGDVAFVSRILMEARSDDGVYRPLISLHLPASLDSLRATVEVSNIAGEGDLEIQMRLLRFRSDTTVASPPYWLVPSRASLAYQGAEFDRADTLQVSRRTLDAGIENAEVVFFMPTLSSGIYLIEIEGRDEAGIHILQQRRLLSVKNASFPEIVVLDDLVDALAYIAFEREIDEIREAASPIDMKRRLDAFWGSLVPNRNAASNLIKLYYSRIEEANLFFSGYKEGWKTDRGMIYTILGPPHFIDARIETEVWHYSYSDRDPVNTYVFERVRSQDEDPFENYILQRRPYYQHEWARAIDRWRDGEVL